MADGILGVQPGYEGFAALGDMLAGGQSRRAEAKRGQYVGEASDAAFKFNRASEERAKAIIAGMQQSSREGLPAALGGVYTDPKEAALATAVLGSNSTIDMDQLGHFQKPGYTALAAEQQDALAKGDFKRMNAVTSVLGDDQFEPVIVKGGSFIENGATLGDLDAIPTPESLSRIEQNEAQGKAALIRANKPPAQRAASTHRPTATSEERDILEQARQRIAQGADPAKVANYLRGKGYPGVAKKIYGGQ